MSRSKKSRKPGVGSSGMPKPRLDKATLANTSDKKPKKKTGKVSGNKQLEAEKKKNTQQRSQQIKDPRLGSKKPIVLTKSVADSQPKKKQAKNKPIAAVRVLEPSESKEQRLIAIEQDEKLLTIIAKQDDDIALTETEIDYYNQLMDEHAKIQEALGVSDEEETLSADNSQPISEDALWDKLDNSDYSDFDFEQDK